LTAFGVVVFGVAVFGVVVFGVVVFGVVAFGVAFGVVAFSRSGEVLGVDLPLVPTMLEVLLEARVSDI